MTPEGPDETGSLVGEAAAGEKAAGEKAAGDATAGTPWLATVLTLFPEMFPGPLGASLAGRGLEAGLWALDVLDIRDFARDKHRSVDDLPFGGGPGMVMRAEVVDAALAAVGDRPGPLIYLSPRGAPLTQERVRALAEEPGARLLCGRYEGIDERIFAVHAIEEVSVGDYVLSGGEPAALVLMDAVVRLLPGVMGNEESRSEESFESGLLEYPHYTRPARWRDLEVPEVLLSGHHERIRDWRGAQAEAVTRARRPELLEGRGPSGPDGRGPAGDESLTDRRGPEPGRAKDE